MMMGYRSRMAARVPNKILLTEAPAIRFEEGAFVLPDAPGFGLEPDLEMLRAYPFQPQPRSERGGALWT